MSKHYFDDEDYEYELQYSDDNSYKNSKKNKRCRRVSRNLKHAYLNSNGNDLSENGVEVFIDKRYR